MKKLVAKGATSLALLSLTALPVLAQDTEAAAAAPAAVSPEVAYIFNTLLFLIGGFLVMWMAAGFAMLEAGLVRSKNVSMQCLKNITLYAIAGLMFWITGYNLMYTGVDGGFMGSFGPYAFDAVGGDALDTGYSTASDWFFQMVFCATTASIVSGTLAERIKLWPFLAFTVVLTGIIYPITGSWEWGGGWLNGEAVKAIGGAEFSDFAGSTLVHSVGGWAALAGAVILGARKGKYGADGSVHPFPGSSMPLATLGTFILWLGWFGFNGASQLAMGSIGDVSDISRIFANTNMAAAAGVVVAVVLTQILYKKVDVTMALNGALAGLVAITAEPLAPSVWVSVFVGGVGGVIVVFAVPMLDKLKIDDVVGAIPVHLLAGIWGTLIVPLSNSDASYVTQLIGIVSIGAFTLVVSSVIWFVLKATMGIRVSEEEEALGLDKVEIGVEAYPEFGTGSGRL
ncbi:MULTISPECIES: ammonium transporter [Stappiaceae]|jgi:Amt family ammonium transporter|uniref:ammonium transporter n=1 Tax=Stappiaceae TaxID=2821832 RepID=UPI0003B7F46F|nr:MULTISPECIES: ammonium transporter [Stappiaceae]ERP87623.1 ammonium transporter [Labrenzia sp. C1B10]ERS07926.1 ammonium transporter [Labrenzia sp. C1B70]MBO6858741.1 ammonium transporter [Roseibium sp.]QFS97369.1 Ammonium transporter NrgA [Labrenzia sp. THAF191b]QFT03684.1 Ammonium transporter NrgA [Labrenzia sp. THAF191a]